MVASLSDAVIQHRKFRYTGPLRKAGITVRRYRLSRSTPLLQVENSETERVTCREYSRHCAPTVRDHKTSLICWTRVSYAISFLKIWMCPD